MVPCVEADVGVRSELHAMHKRCSPIGNIGVVKRWLEKLVLKDESLLPVKSVVNLFERVGEALLPIPKVTLTRVVRAVGKPDF